MPEVHMLLQVHDELVFEAPKALVEGAMKLIKEEWNMLYCSIFHLE